MRRAVLFFTLVASGLSGCATTHSGAIPTAEPQAGNIHPPPADRTRLAEAFRLAEAISDSVWPGWTRAPFAVLLVTPGREFLLRHPSPSADFVRVGYDSLLQTSVFVRPRVFSPALLATFPAVLGVPTIVIGPAELTGKHSTAWVLTILHEHFHQLQTSRPDYYAGVAALNLARGDETGMWMLNYPFPYDSAVVRARFAAFTRSLAAAVALRGSGESAAAMRTVIDARDHLRASLSAADYRYLAFQMWQEGVARYTELQVARLAAKHYVPTAAFQALPDYTEFSIEAAALEREIHAGLSNVQLERAKRVAFYPAGAATALLLDATVPGWKRDYFERAFSLDAQFP